ncbi:alpha/beta fold hydrolase [Chryseobacterium wangxinyae]|uniref:alpha/beta fold hydrolase n=1 Tax=Chryseobacterium sp. CY353 TaxID=2997334 RepID=UPI0022700830|nr:hypothetical protein [Chryseobacterium sp. CY353]MCY0970461.1 hypothetical protein [Chryseobacterium sp. CY353]
MKKINEGYIQSSSSHQYQKVLSQLSDDFHLIAPDYPSFGNSDFPLASKYEYTL